MMVCHVGRMRQLRTCLRKEVIVLQNRFGLLVWFLSFNPAFSVSHTHTHTLMCPSSRLCDVVGGPQEVWLLMISGSSTSMVT